MRVAAFVFLGVLATVSGIFAQNPPTIPTPSTAAPPTAKSIAPSAQGVSAGRMYHRVYVVSPLVGTGRAGDPKRPVFAPAPPQPPAKGATITPTVTPSNHAGLLGYQMQLSDDGKTALVEMVFSDPISFQTVMQQEASTRSISVPTTAAASPGAVSSSLTTALQSAVPGLQIFERGKATDAQILSVFQTYKANFSLNGTTVRPQ